MTEATEDYYAHLSEAARAAPLSTGNAFPPKRKIPRESLCEKRTGGFIVNPGKQKFFPAGCMAWSCRQCAKILAYRVIKRLQLYQWTAKLELTLDGDGRPTRENNIRLAKGTRSVLQFVRRYFRRKYGEAFSLRYARMHGVGEQRGRLHSHMVWDAPFIPQEVLSEHAEACGLGFRVYIRGIDARHEGGDEAVRYVADQAVRYVAQQAQGGLRGADLPRGARRFQSADVAPYEPEPGWHWQECTPEFPWDPHSLDAGRRYAEAVAGSQIDYSGNRVRIPVGIERTPHGFLILSSLVVRGETASAWPHNLPEKLRQMHFGPVRGFT